MNTAISYMYRDGSNFKAYDYVVLSGLITWDQVKALAEDGEYIIAHEVGLPELQHQLTGFPNEDDHVYHEIDGVESTDQQPTMTMTAMEFLQLLREAPYDVPAAMERLGIPIEV